MDSKLPETLAQNTMGSDPAEPRQRVVARDAELAAAGQQLGRQRSWLNWALLLFLLLACVFAWLVLAGGGTLWPLATVVALLVPVIVMRLRVRARLRRVRRLVALYREVLARMDGLAGGGSRGEEFLGESHPYARDLNIVGEHSLMAALPPPRTRAGDAALAALLLDATEPAEVRGRQQAVRELAPDLALREGIALLGDDARQTLSAARLRDWAARAPLVFPRGAAPALLLLSALLIAVVVAASAHVVSWPLARSNAAALLAVEMLLTLRLRTRVAAALDAADGLSGEVRLLRETVELLKGTSPQATLLVHLRAAAMGGDEIGGAHRSSASLLSELESRLAFVDRRRQPWSIVLSVLLAAGTQSAIALERWRARNGRTLARVVEAWGQFDALNSLAALSFEHPQYVFPTLDESGPAHFVAEDLRHPLLSPASAVGNDVALGGEDGARFLLLSGSNMSGKSTLLRAVGIAVALSYAGAPVPCTSARLSLVRLCASITPADSLAEGRSRFLAELEQLRAMLRPAGVAGAIAPPTLFLIDEILGGTNSADRRAAAESILRRLLSEGAIGVISTHDLALIPLAEDASLQGANAHMSSPDPDDPLRFDFKVRAGVNAVSSAPALIELLGL